MPNDNVVVDRGECWEPDPIKRWWQIALCVAIGISFYLGFPHSMMGLLFFGMILIYPFALPSFTEPTEYLPLSMIIATGIYLFVARSPRTERWYQRARTTAFCLAGLFPLPFLVPVYAQSFRAMALIGKWPPVMYDPKIIGSDDALYQTLANVTATGMLYCGASVWILGLLCLSLRRYLRARDWVWLLLLLVFANSVLFGDRFAWWMD